MTLLKSSALYAVMCALVVACGSGDSTSDGTDQLTTSDAGTSSRDASSSVGVDAGSSTASACSELTYELFGQAFLQSYCVSCHGSPVVQDGVRLDTLANLIKNKKKARSQVSGKAMPPRGSTAPSSAERAMFAQWIDCGPL